MVLASDSLGQMDGSLVLHHDENESETNPDDILVRRLKNRERQRRYRARKRHEADRQKVASSIDRSTPMHYQQMMPTDLLSVPVEVDISVNLTSPERVTRVHCPRDWKRDARRAHVLQKHESGHAGPSNSGVGSSSETFLECEGKADNNATHISQSSRRHWKAEARNKKSSE
ncbi:hypothetical protein PHJA_001794600 [Phtheirospermum japonicum]|uniref:BZIP domain-containing protein n=1 Tax=Phtheirospermum japonicum TaxID=374723 RepID=A0A830CN71_9LAMI|nr:hypothetical protein PHJA_001794600 [Phtheirospermum japonicum]